MKKFFFMVGMWMGCICAYPQIPEDVMDYINAAQREGKTPAEMADYLKSRNMESPKGDSVAVVDRTRIPADTSSHKPDTKSQAVDSVFGRALFGNNRLTFEPNLAIPTPPNYRIGAGDELILDVWGNSEETFRLAVSPDGNVLVSGVGPVVVNGLRISEAEEVLKRALGRKYSDLLSPTPHTFMQLSLGRVRSIQVNVVGEVAMSGTYTLPSLATLFHALYVAGGVNPVGSLRNVELCRHGKCIARMDVYDYLLDGSTCDVVLQDGDVVRVNIYDKLVKTTGHVKRPMYYELEEGDTLDSLLRYCGGFTGNAYKKAVTVRRKGDSEHEIHTVPVHAYATFPLQDGDVVEISPILNRYANKVSVDGAVFRPGDYAIGPHLKTVEQLIASAEGLRGDAFVQHAVLYREREDLSKTVLAVDLTDTVAIALQRNDVLFVPSMAEIHESYRIGIYGDVLNPGEYDYYDNMTVEDLILRAGGVMESASTVRVDIARRVKHPQSTREPVVISQLFSLPMQAQLHRGDTNFRLQPFDCVYVRRSPAYRTQSSVQIVGEVLYAGTYTRETSNERLSDIIRRAGGVTSNGYIRGAKLVRKLNPEERSRLETSMRLTEHLNDTLSASMLDFGDEYTVGIDLERALRHPGSDADVVLREGDVIHIPDYCGTVKVSGGVMYPNAVAYSSRKKLDDYIENGGGFAIGASKRRVYVIYMNGTVAVRRRGRIRIEPGCEIIVPMRQKNTMDMIKWLSLTNSTASLAAMVATIVNLSK